MSAAVAQLDIFGASVPVQELQKKKRSHLRIVKPEETKAIFSDAQIVDAAYQHFRATGFPYRNLPVHVCMEEINKLATTPDMQLMNTRTAYHVADTYHPHRFHAAAASMKSPFQAFSDDKTFKRALTLKRQFSRAIGNDVIGKLLIVSGTQACANFRPGFALHLYRQYCEAGAVVLDTSTGYGGRLVGFLASGVAGRYIGIDPSTKTHAGNLRMAKELGFSDAVELYNVPAEDLPHDVVANRCDFAFTSPPYFAKEHYSNEPTQSYLRYPTGYMWLQGFLKPMLALQYAALKAGCYSIINIADVRLRGKVYPLEQWTVDAAQAAGFEYIKTERFELTKRFGKSQSGDVATEPLIILRKPE